ncbi:MAG: serine/threonine-protein kinase [Planctomycetes bacterium]|nr:serine/threonine-protein kinase [Planctomycetota bacterium]
MSNAQRRQAEALFQQVADLSPQQRAKYLDEHAGDTPDVRAEVESLLAHLDDETLPLLAPVEQLDDADAELVGQSIGPYRLQRLLGEGGFGLVYQAEQEHPVRRQVALKIIKLGMDTKQVIARFEAERQALALMEHPNIAKVLDAGATHSGRPYFVMELVKGIPITEYCDRNNLATTERLLLFAQVCRAVQHAHQKGIIHRDLKPSNVIVTLRDGAPVPKVIDFGIAKAMSQRLTERTLFTEFLQFIGTPQYMSPEQAEMSGLDIDTRSDIYSLGVLLYELLTGTTPFDAEALRSVSYGEIQRIIREEEPPTPSRRLSTLGAQLPLVAKARHAEPQTLQKLLSGDLDWIVMKALEKDRTRRYETAAGLAADIQRHLDHEPVLAGPPGAGYKLYKFVQRNRVSVLAGSIVVAALLGGLALATVGFVRASSAAARAAREAESATAINTFFNNMLASVDPMQLRRLSSYASDPLATPVSGGGFARDVSVAEMVCRASAEIERAFAGKPELAATARETIGMTLRGLGRYADAQPQLQAALDLRQRTLGKDHPDTLRASLALGDLLFETGQPAEGEPLVRTALEGMRRIYGKEHPKTLSCGAILASVLSDQRKYSQSEALFKHTLEAQRRVLGPDHRDTLATMWRWSVSYLLQRKLPEGQALARELYDTCSRTLDPQDSLNILSRPLLGWWYVARFEYAAAERVLRGGLEQCRRILGEKHPFTCMTMQGLARALQGREAQAETEQLYRQALAGLRGSRGKLHWQTISTTYSFAMWLDERGRFDEAELLYRTLVADSRRAWGAKDYYTLDAMLSLASFLERAGKLDEATAVLREHLGVVQQFYRGKGLSLHHYMDTFAQALVRMGKVAEGRRVTQELIDFTRRDAEAHDTDPITLNLYAWTLLTCRPTAMRDVATALPIAEAAAALSAGKTPAILDTLALAYHLSGDNDRAVEVQLKSMALLPPEAGSEVTYGAQLVRYLLQQGETAAADKYVLESVAKFRAALGEDNPTLTMSYNRTGMSLASAGHYALAEAMLGEALELSRNLLGEEHEQVAHSLENLANLRCLQGQYGQAEETYRAALALRRKLLGDDHLHVARTEYALGLALRAGGDLDAAVEALTAALETHRRLGVADIPAALIVKRDLARVLTEQGRFDEAESLADEAAAKLRKLFGDEHADPACAASVVALRLIGQGHADEAEPILRRCAEVVEGLDLPVCDKWLAAEVQNMFGHCLTELECYAEAEALLLPSYEALRAARGEAYIGTRAALRRLVALYESWGKPDQAARWREKGVPPAFTSERGRRDSD